MNQEQFNRLIEALAGISSDIQDARQEMGCIGILLIILIAAVVLHH